MHLPMTGVRRTPADRPFRIVALAILTLSLVFGGFAATPPSTHAAAQVKVVIVVGPVEGDTAKNISRAKGYAALARSLGASVTEVYSPRATYSQVTAAAVGANIFMYLGHGNGYPSPYGAFTPYRRNGMGLNARSGHGNYNVKYWASDICGRACISPRTPSSC